MHPAFDDAELSRLEAQISERFCDAEELRAAIQARVMSELRATQVRLADEMARVQLLEATLDRRLRVMQGAGELATRSIDRSAQLVERAVRLGSIDDDEDAEGTRRTRLASDALKRISEGKADAQTSRTALAKLRPMVVTTREQYERLNAMAPKWIWLNLQLFACGLLGPAIGLVVLLAAGALAIAIDRATQLAEAIAYLFGASDKHTSAVLALFLLQALLYEPVVRRLRRSVARWLSKKILASFHDWRLALGDVSAAVQRIATGLASLSW